MTAKKKSNQEKAASEKVTINYEITKMAYDCIDDIRDASPEKLSKWEVVDLALKYYFEHGDHENIKKPEELYAKKLDLKVLRRKAKKEHDAIISELERTNSRVDEVYELQVRYMEKKEIDMVIKLINLNRKSNENASSERLYKRIKAKLDKADTYIKNFEIYKFFLEKHGDLINEDE